MSSTRAPQDTTLADLRAAYGAMKAAARASLSGDGIGSRPQECPACGEVVPAVWVVRSGAVAGVVLSRHACPILREWT